MKKIKNALISVFYKEGLEDLLKVLDQNNIRIFSTGGTLKFIQEQGIDAVSVESLTGYPSILGGRVKTLHPKVFGGILGRRELEEDRKQMKELEIPAFDMVVVNLYPFEETLQKTDDEQEIIEKIDIGGISLIRAAAKNFKEVLVVSSPDDYSAVAGMLKANQGETRLEQRKLYAAKAFNASSHYDTAIYHYFNAGGELKNFKQSIQEPNVLRYGENPHQEGIFYGKLRDVFEQLHGKAISYNNLLDLDAAINLINEFDETTFAVLKHNNACGLSNDENLTEAWKKALAGDPVSAFGGVLITNRKVNEQTAQEINKLFFEIILAPSYEKNALEILKAKKNRIILQQRSYDFPRKIFRSVLNGTLVQDRDLKTEKEADLKNVTKKIPENQEISDLLFANKIVKHTKSNTIVLAKNKQLIASGVGQTSRVDALKQAIDKAREFGFDLNGSVMASDAFFPFSDSVEIANKAGITAVIQPGGSIRDRDSVEYCDENNMAMVFTGTRHFKH